MSVRALWLLMLITSVSALSQSSEKLLELAQDVFANPSGYEFHGTGLLQPEGLSWQVKFSVVIAAAPEPLETPDAPVTPGGRIGGPFQFVKTGEGTDDKPKSVAIPFAVTGGWARIATNVTSVKEVGTERSPLNGEMTNCRVLEVQYKPLPPKTELAPVRYSICSDRHLALKKVMSYSAGRKPTNPGGLWTITLDSARFNRLAPQWLRDLKTLPATMTRNEWLGKEAPDFHLNGLGGQTVELSTLRGKAVLFDFWSNACIPRLREMPTIQRLAKEHKDNLIVWGVSFDQPERDRKWFVEHQQGFPTLSDTEYEVSDLYKVQGIPALVLISAKGVVCGYWEGAVQMEDLEAAFRKGSCEK